MIGAESGAELVANLDARTRRLGSTPATASKASLGSGGEVRRESSRTGFEPASSSCQSVCSRGVRRRMARSKRRMARVASAESERPSWARARRWSSSERKKDDASSSSESKAEEERARASGVAASADGDARGGGWRRHVAGDALLVAGSFDARVRDRVRLEHFGRPETAPLSRPARCRRRGGGLANDVPGGGWRGRGVDGAGEGRRRGSTRRRRGWVSRRARVEHRAGRAPARPLRRRPERGVVLARELAEVGVSRGGDGGAARRRRARDELRRHRRRASMCAARAARRKANTPGRRWGLGRTETTLHLSGRRETLGMVVMLSTPETAMFALHRPHTGVFQNSAPLLVRPREPPGAGSRVPAVGRARARRERARFGRDVAQQGWPLPGRDARDWVPGSCPVTCPPTRHL